MNNYNNSDIFYSSTFAESPFVCLPCWLVGWLWRLLAVYFCCCSAFLWPGQQNLVFHYMFFIFVFLFFPSCAAIIVLMFQFNARIALWYFIVVVFLWQIVFSFVASFVNKFVVCCMFSKSSISQCVEIVFSPHPLHGFHRDS